MEKSSVNDTVFKCVTYLGITSLLVLPWIVRNQKVFNVSRLSNVDATNYVYYLGAGAYQLKHKVSLEEAQTMISEEFNLATNVEHHNPWLSTKSPYDLDHELRLATIPVLLSYPKDLLLSCVMGFTKFMFAHNKQVLAYIIG